MGGYPFLIFGHVGADAHGNLSLRASAHTGVGRRAVRRQWQMKHGERVAAVKISVALIPLRNLGHRNRKSVSGPLV